MNPERYLRIQRVLSRRQPDLTVLMEQVNKAHNFSAILRNCDAVGALAAHVVLPDSGVSLSNHTSAGSSKWVRVRTHPDVETAVERLKGEGFRILAAHPAPGARDYRDADFTRPVGIMVGAELDGISQRGLALADELVFVPMAGMVRSLNVSVATAVMLYEAFRQRTEAGMYEESRLSGEEYRRILFEWCHPKLAAFLRRKRLPYPPLDAEGEPVLEPGITRA